MIRDREKRWHLGTMESMRLHELNITEDPMWIDKIGKGSKKPLMNLIKWDKELKRHWKYEKEQKLAEDIFNSILGDDLIDSLKQQLRKSWPWDNGELVDDLCKEILEHSGYSLMTEEDLMVYPILGQVLSYKVLAYQQLLASLAMHLQRNKGALSILLSIEDPEEIPRLVSKIEEVGPEHYLVTIGHRQIHYVKGAPVKLHLLSKWIQFINEHQEDGHSSEGYGDFVVKPLSLPMMVLGSDHGFYFTNTRAVHQNHGGSLDKDLGRELDFLRGRWLSVAYILEGREIYAGSMTQKESQIEVDPQCFFSPLLFPVQLRQTQARKKLMDLCEDSVQRTGILPKWEYGPQGDVYDISAMMPTTEECHDIDPEAFIQGFKFQYKWFIEHRRAIEEAGLLEGIKGKVAFYGRHGDIYKGIIRQINKSPLMKEVKSRRRVLYTLIRDFIESEKKPSLWQFFSQEHEALYYGEALGLWMDVESGEISSGNKSIIKVRSIKEGIISRLQQLNDSDMDCQIMLIKNSLHPRYGRQMNKMRDSLFFRQVDRSSSPPLGGFYRQRLLTQCKYIANRLMESSRRNEKDLLQWELLLHGHSYKGYSFSPVGASLYDGKAGIAFYLGALYHVTKDCIYKAWALASLEELSHCIKQYPRDMITGLGIGGFNGTGSLFYVWCYLSRWLAAPYLIEEVKGLAYHLEDKDIEGDQRNDLLSGSAGLMMGLLALYRVTGDEVVYSKMLKCGQHLIENADKIQLTGLSHGLAGIALALSHLYDVTGDEIYKYKALELVRKENSCYNYEEQNWPDLRTDEGVKKGQGTYSWCNGCTGIALARSGMMTLLPEESMLKEDVERGIKSTMEYGMSHSDFLCCGNMGRVHTLMEVGRRRNNKELQNKAKTLAYHLVKVKEKQGYYGLSGVNGRENPTFFQGIAGIGYGILSTIANLPTMDLDTRDLLKGVDKDEK